MIYNKINILIRNFETIQIFCESVVNQSKREKYSASYSCTFMLFESSIICLKLKIFGVIIILRKKSEQ